MTAVTDAFAQSQILAEVGDPNGTLAAIIVGLWAGYSDKGAIDPRLQFLYTKRSAIDVRLAETQGTTDYTLDGVSEKASGAFDQLTQMRTSTETEIQRVEALARGRRAPAYGAITTTSPLVPQFPTLPDATDPRYSGSPYAPEEQPIT